MPGNEVMAYCRRYGVSVDPWTFSKRPEEYTTMNEWFTRLHSEGVLRFPASDEPTVVAAPATAVVSMYPSVIDMPKSIKNDAFSIDGIVVGI